MKQVTMGLVFSLGIVLAATVAPAAERYWSNTSGGDFGEGANWVGGTAPATNDNVSFTNAASYTVTFGGSMTNDHGRFGAAGGTITLDLGGGTEWRLTGGGDSLQLIGAGGTVGLSGGTISTADKFGLGMSAGHNGNTFNLYGGAILNLSGTYGEAYLGENGYGNALTLSGGASLLSRRDVLLGVGTGASSNTVVLTGSGTLLRASTGGSGILIVGVRGDSNELRVENGATLSNLNARIGGGTPSGVAGGTGHVNRVIVTGGGLWTNTGSVSIGVLGRDNGVTVSSNGVLQATGSLNVGEAGPANTLSVLAGGSVSVSLLNVGLAAASSNNSALVSGSNSLLRLRDWDLESGVAGSGNSLSIRGGGQVQVKRSILVGRDLSASNNLILVTGPGSLLGGGQNVSVGANGSGNELRIEDGGLATNAVSYVGGTLASSVENLGITTGNLNRVTVTGGGVWSNSSHLYLGCPGQGNTVTVNSNGSIRSSYFFIGNGGAGNTMAVGPGGTASAVHIFVGTTAASSNNALVVSGPGALLRSSQFDVSVGKVGVGNSLAVDNGGQVIVTRHVYVGTDNLAANAGTNSSLAIGSGGLLEVGGGTLQVGTGPGNGVSNTGGILQFTSASPSLINGGSAARIGITDGTVSFRAVNSADVRISGAGFAMDSTKLTWGGRTPSC